MQGRRRRAVCGALALLLSLLLSGCGLGGKLDELFSLPQLSAEYLELQRVIDGVLAAGAVYSAPVTGTHRQSVQLCDMDGDGVEEALAFFSGSGEHPLKIHIFTQSGGSYTTAAVIEGDGTSIESIDYVDMDGDGRLEAVVGWGMGAGLKMLCVYSLKGYQVSAIVTADYTQYAAADLNGDGRAQLLVLRQATPDSEKGGTVELFTVDADGETVSTAARLSAGAEGITKTVVAALKDLPAALYVESSRAGELVTDIFVCEDGQLRNITLSPDSGLSEGTVRDSVIACRDINGDGVPEIPIPRALPAQGETVYRVLDWYGYNSRGKRTIALSTYYNYSDSWYLVLPGEWGNDISIRRETGEAGERAVVFSRWNGAGQPVSDFLEVCAISGENREDLAAKEGRILLYRSDEVLYTAALLPGGEGWGLAPDAASLRSSFQLIYSDWISGY